MIQKRSAIPYLVQADGLEIEIVDRITIGRAPDCTLMIDNDLVSRHHTEIERAGGQVVLSDLNSHNGTWVNELRINSPCILKNGDRIRIGRTHFTFRETAPFVASLAESNSNTPVLSIESGSTRSWETVEPITLVRLSDGAEIGLNRSMKVGRDKTNGLVINEDDSVSQVHAEIDLKDSDVQVTDLESRNGTWVNDKRISRPTILRHGDRLRFGNVVFRLKIGDRSLPGLTGTAPARKSIWTRAVILSIIFFALTGFCFLILPAIKPILFPTPTPRPTIALPTATATESPVEVAQRALRSLVIVVARLSNSYVSIGSGSLIGSDGIVLTNYHVIEGNTGLILVGLNWQDPESQPHSYYRCEVLQQDPDLDLAVLRVVEVAAGDPFLSHSLNFTFQPLPDTLVFPSIEIGNSDELMIGDAITVIGFPGVGGQTPTLTNGNVSGFLPDEELGFSRGWIKTDAEISLGNSGGMAINRTGELVGVPTLKTTGTDYLGFIRPINFALDLIRSSCPECVP